MFAFSCVAFFVAIDIGMTNGLAISGNFHLTALFPRRFQCRQYVIFSFHAAKVQKILELCNT